MFDDREVCGTCKWHMHEGIDDGWVCTCADSEFCADWTEYSDKCEQIIGTKGKRKGEPMADLISRQAAIEAIEEMQIPIMRSEFSDEQLIFTGMSEALAEIKRLPSAQPEQQWIPCSERLPEYGQAVLVALDGGSMTDGVRSSDHAGRSVWDCALDNRTWYDDENIVIAWMPLPEPYEGEQP